MSNELEKQLKADKQKLKSKKEFYNYKHWREIQRNQLGTSANLYFVFSSAIFGFILNFLIEKSYVLFYGEKFFLITAMIFLLISLIFYTFFTENRLKDFQNTAKLIKDVKNYDEIKYYDEITKLSEAIGKRSWNLYYNQRCFLILGFLFSLIGFSIYIF